MVWRILVAVVLLSVSAQAQTYRLRVEREHSDGEYLGTCCCVGHTDDGDAVLVTAGHNVRSAIKIEIRVGDKWHRCKVVHKHSDADVACLEVRGAKLKAFAKIRRAKVRERVRVGGFGGEYHGRTKTTLSAVVDQDGFAVLPDGQHVVTGDSGGFVAADEGLQLLGIISGYRSDSPAHTVIEPADAIVECLQRRYRCGPAGCPPVWIRPTVTQPFLGPFPIGPPRPIGIVDPMPPITLIPPSPRPDPDSPPGPVGGTPPSADAIRQAVSDWMAANADAVRGRDGKTGPTGATGATGETGPAGRSVKAAELNAIVDAWLESNRDSLRGEPADPPSPDAIRQAVADWMAANAESLRGRDGIVDAEKIRQIVRMEVEVLMAEIPDKPKVPTDEASERKRLLYFTSKLGCPACAKTDESVRKLKDRGYPITIIDLDPRETEIKGVPRVFHPSSGRDVLGPQAVADYLASVGY